MLKKIIFSAFLFLLFMNFNTVVNAEPVYINQTKDQYFNELLDEFKKDGYKEAPDNYRERTFPVTELKREILVNGGTDPQFYIAWGSEFTTNSYIQDREGWARDYETYGKNGQIELQKKNLKGQSMAMYPTVFTRFREDDWRGSGLRANLPAPIMFESTSTSYSQGFMYAESDPNGENVKIRQFDYEKDANAVKVLWNSKTESFITMFKERNDTKLGIGDKIMVLRTDVDKRYRHVRVTGQIFYFGQSEKNITLLNQMIYDPFTQDTIDNRINGAWEVYGKGKGIIQKNKSDNSNLIIRMDTVNKPLNWTLSSYPFKGKYKNATGNKASDPKNFMEGFSSTNTIDATGFEADANSQVTGYPLSKETRYSVWTDDNVVNSIKMKSKREVLRKGQSMKLSYGFEPSTLYKVPTIQPVPPVTKEVSEPLDIDLDWTDQFGESDGGKIEYSVGTKKLGTITYEKNGDFDGSVKLHIPAEEFKYGEQNQVKLKIMDSVYGDPGVKDDEHTSDRIFLVNNKRKIPIKYETQLGENLDLGETTKSILALDNETINVNVPGEMGSSHTGKNYPLLGVKPEKDSNLSLNSSKKVLSIIGKESFSKDGVTVTYKITERKGKVIYEDSKGRPIEGQKPQEVLGGAGMPYDFGPQLSSGEKNPKSLVRNIEGYQFVEANPKYDPIKGDFPEGLTTTLDIRMVYKKLNPTVTTHYLQLDKQGNKTDKKVFKDLKTKLRQEPYVNDDAEIGEEISKVTPIVPFDEGYIYEDSKKEMNYLDGTPVIGDKVPEDDFIVKYYYRPVETISVPSKLNFGDNNSHKSNVVYGVKEESISQVKIVNTYEDDKWQLVASTNGMKSVEDQSILIADIYYEDANGKRLITYDTRPLATKDQNVVDRLPMSSKDGKKEGLFVKVRQENKKGRYNGAIKFTLQSAP